MSAQETREDLSIPENRVSKVIVDAAVGVHTALGGPGLLEGVYEEALAFELGSRGIGVNRQFAVPIIYKGRRLGSDLRVDLLVNEQVVVECKAVSVYNPVFDAQVLTYLRLQNLRLGLVINFGARRIVDGLHRVVIRL